MPSRYTEIMGFVMTELLMTSEYKESQPSIITAYFQTYFTKLSASLNIRIRLILYMPTRNTAI